MSESPAVSSLPQAELTARVLNAEEPGLSGALKSAHAAIAQYVELRTTPSHTLRPRQEASQFPTEQKAIRVAVARVVGILRERGVPPERVLISLKDLLATMPRCDGDVEHELREQVIGWAIEDYYR